MPLALKTKVFEQFTKFIKGYTTACQQTELHVPWLIGLFELLDWPVCFQQQ